MVFTVADLIARPSCETTLLAGTLIPQHLRRGGLPAPTPVRFAGGDRVSIEIEGTGRLTNREELA
jgi:2-keto-4-pentenoate hydratase/2-oxohepta-3-ene-1,7-dioic acid hydratase in catechol pathway